MVAALEESAAGAVEEDHNCVEEGDEGHPPANLTLDGAALGKGWFRITPHIFF